MESGLSIASSKRVQQASSACAGIHKNLYQPDRLWACPKVLLSLLFVAFANLLIVSGQVFGAGVYDSSTEVTYREYWISHEWFTGGDACAESPVGNKWYIEPLEFGSRCPMYFDIDDDFSNAPHSLCGRNSPQ